jgi:chitinase
MTRQFVFALLLTFASIFWVDCNPIVNNDSNKKIICYFDSWAYYRAENGKFSVENIDSTLCTHVVYAFFGISDDHKIEVLDPHLQNELHDIEKFVAHNEHKAKSLIAIGGANFKSSKFSRMASDEAERTRFVESVMSFLRFYKLDGVMIDWEFPDKEDVENYVKLLDKFDEHMAHTNFELGVSVSPLKSQIDVGYDVHHFVNFVDFINVLSYDYSGPWANKTDHSSPLHSSNNNNNILNSQAASLEYWHKDKGVPKEKLILSLPLFGRTWKLFNSQNPGRGAFAEGPEAPGPITSTAGLLAYNELCSMMKSDPQLWTQYYDSKAEAVYAVNYKHWVSFENVKTMAAKANFVQQMGYGGVSLFALSYDDFSGICGQKFGLLHAVNEVFRPQVEEPPIDTIHDVFKCQRNGYFRDYNDCRKWYICATNESGAMTQSPHFCEKFFAFDPEMGTCNKKELVKGCEHDI